MDPIADMFDPLPAKSAVDLGERSEINVLRPPRRYVVKLS
jgi:hypothetical protein